MSVEKATIKIGTAHELGVQFDDMLEAAEKDAHVQEGAFLGLQKATHDIVGLIAHVKKDLEEGKLGEFGEHALKVADYAIRYVQRASGVTENLATTAQVSKLKALGKADGLRAAVGNTKKMMEGEQLKLAAHRALVERGEVSAEGSFSGPPEERPTGVHPGNPAAARKEGKDVPVSAAASDIALRRRTKGRRSNGAHT